MAKQQNSVFMIGWEYPPHNSGGLGIACEGLTQALSKDDTKVHFSLPYESGHGVDHMNIHYCVHDNWRHKDCDCKDKSGKCVNVNCEPPFFAYSQEVFQSRYLPSSILSIDHQTDIYDDVVAFYNWHEGEVFGVEIYNDKVASMQRQIFEILWGMGKEEPKL